MAFKDKIYATVTSQTGITPKNAQLAVHTAVQAMKAKMPAAIAISFQKMLDSEDGSVGWQMVASAPVPMPVQVPVQAQAPVPAKEDKPKTLVSNITAVAPAPPASTRTEAPVFVPKHEAQVIPAPAKKGFAQRVKDYWAK